MSDFTPRRFSDDQARAILARAIEIDAHAPMTTTDDLRAIAAEIGVSPASLEAALREQTTALEARRSIAGQRAASALAAGGVPLGVAVGWLLASAPGQATLGLMGLGLTGAGLIASAALVVLQGATGSLRSFHLKNLALWGGVAAGSLVAIAVSGGEIARVPALITVGWCVRSWIASSILGSAAVVAVRRARRPDGSDPDADVAETSLPTGSGRWARVAKRVRDWMSRTLRRDSARVPIVGRQLDPA